MAFTVRLSAGTNRLTPLCIGKSIPVRNRFKIEAPG